MIVKAVILAPFAYLAKLELLRRTIGFDLFSFTLDVGWSGIIANQLAVAAKIHVRHASWHFVFLDWRGIVSQASMPIHPCQPYRALFVVQLKAEIAGKAYSPYQLTQ